MPVVGPSDLFQHDTRSCKVQLWVGGRIHLLCDWHRRQRTQMRPVEHAVYKEIKRGGGLSADDFQGTVIKGGRAPPRHRLQRQSVFKASDTETNLLGNQQWHLHLLQNGETLGQIEHSYLVSESDEILRKCLTHEEKWFVTLYKQDWRHIHKHSNMYTFQTRRTASHGPATVLDLKTCCLTRKGVNLWLPSTGSSPGGVIK